MGSSVGHGVREKRSLRGILPTARPAAVSNAPNLCSRRFRNSNANKLRLENAGFLENRSECKPAARFLSCAITLSGPGLRDVLIELFEREFIESQEALGMTLVGQFRDLDNPDRFVWLRGFADMTIRAQALEAFYSGPIWRAHRAAANETMIDSDNVLLL